MAEAIVRITLDLVDFLDTVRRGVVVEDGDGLDLNNPLVQAAVERVLRDHGEPIEMQACDELVQQINHGENDGLFDKLLRRAFEGTSAASVALRQKFEEKIRAEIEGARKSPELPSVALGDVFYDIDGFRVRKLVIKQTYDRLVDGGKVLRAIYFHFAESPSTSGYHKVIEFGEGENLTEKFKTAELFRTLEEVEDHMIDKTNAAIEKANTENEPKS